MRTTRWIGTFLVRMREVAPGFCKWLEFINPTHVAMHVFSRGRVIPSAAGGQQGCPLMGALSCTCEAHGARKFGSRAPLSGSQVQPPINQDIAPTSADDGSVAGDDLEVLRAIQRPMRVMPLVGLRHSLMRVVASTRPRAFSSIPR